MKPRRRPRLAGLDVTKLLAVLLGFAVCAAASAGSAQARGLPLQRVTERRLPGAATRFDYQSVDPAGRRLYIAHLGDSAVVAVDVDTLRTVATIHDLADVHGLVAVPDLRRVFATATGSNELVTIDATTERVIARARTGDFPDGLAYDPDDGLVLVSNLQDGSETIVDAHTTTSLRTVKLGDEVGNVAYDHTTRLAWVAVRPPDQLIALDPATGHIKVRIHLPGCDGAHGIYVQPQAHRAFVACENNARLVVVDTTRRRVTTRLRVGEDPDVLAFDPGDRRLYVAAETGVVTVIATGPKPQVLGRALLAEHAHSVAVDPTTHRVFFPLENQHGHAVLLVMQPIIRRFAQP